MYLSPMAVVTKYHKLGRVEQQKCIASQFWRPEVQCQGVSRPMKMLRKDLFQAAPVASGSLRHSLACRRLPSSCISSYHLPSLHVCLCV